MTLIPGTKLGPYQIEAAVGAGGMGEVYRAKDTRLDRTVAIKVLSAALASDPQFRERFDREAKSISALSHPHICTLFDVGSQNDLAFLVMEYLEGETLAARLEKGALQLADALRYAIEIASALDRAHRQGIVHRDLKPGNVILTKSGAKLLDFGLAKTGPAGGLSGSLATALATSPAPLTAQGTILGTFQYMAPEQIEGQEADARSDIFAFGVLLYEMLTGKKAFEAKTHASLIAAILDREPTPVSVIQPLTPAPLDRVIKRCLAKDPDDRWQSAKDLGDELSWIAHGQTGPAAAAATPAGATATTRTNRMAWMIAAAAIVAAVVAGLFAYRALAGVAADAPVMRFDVVTPPTSDPVSFALSPDGRQLVFVAKGPGGPQLWVRPIDNTTARPLAGTEGALFPFWSPDSRSIGFFTDSKVKRIDLAGGTPLALANAVAPRGGTWSHDGVILFTPTTQSGVHKVPATGGAVEAVTQPTGPGSTHRWPQFLPDGRRFLFTVALGAPELNGTYIASLDGGEPRLILTADNAAVFAPPDKLLAVRQGVLVAWQFDPDAEAVTGEPVPVAQDVGDAGVFRHAFSVSATGMLAHRKGGSQQRQWIWFDRAGRRMGTIGGPDDRWPSNPELSPNGRQLAFYRQIQGNNDVWLVDVPRAVPSRFTFDSSNDNSPLWSPDGQTITFGSTRLRSQDLFEKLATGSADERPILTTPQRKVALSWTPDGKFLLYRLQDSQSSLDLWALPRSGKPVPVVHTPFDETEGQFSPDGRWVAYVSNESGRAEVYVRSFPEAGGKWQVSSAGGSQVRWRRDGKEIYYVAPDGMLMASAFLAVSQSPAPEIGAPTALFATQLATGSNITGTKPQYVVAADGRFLMNVGLEDAQSPPITLVVNWRAALKK